MTRNLTPALLPHQSGEGSDVAVSRCSYPPAVIAARPLLHVWGPLGCSTRFTSAASDPRAGMQTAARHSACLVAGSGSLLQQVQAVLPALTFQVTSLTSLSRSSGEQRWPHGVSGGGGGALALAASSSSRAAGAVLILPGQHLVQHTHALQQHQQQQQLGQQRRPIFNFAGLGGDLAKSHHEKKLLG